MDKQKLLTLTLIISGLSLNPVLAETVVVNNTIQTHNTQQSVRAGVSNVLYKRGLDADVAVELSENLIDEEDEILLARLMQHLELGHIVTKDEVLEYLSTVALHKEKVDFKSYDTLIGMVAKIQKKPLDSTTLKHLSHIAKNKLV